MKMGYIFIEMQESDKKAHGTGGVKQQARTR